jgi:hypothetical protein
MRHVPPSKPTATRACRNFADNGVWHAKAFRGRTEVRLIVDARGAVTTAD